MSLDFRHLLSTAEFTDVQVFTTPATVTNLQWLTYRVPAGKSTVYIYCVGGGAGGGGAINRASTVQGTGGGGGGSSGSSRVLIAASLLPSVLYVQVGLGGTGGANGATPATAGTSALLSYVTVYPDFDPSNTLAISGAVAAGGGGGATSAAGGTAGAASTIPVIGSMPLAGLGLFQLIAGQAGAVGGFDAAGTSQPIPVTSALVMGGAGGSGHISTDTAGGAVTAVAGSYLSEQRSAVAVAGATGKAAGGLQLWNPLFTFPGMGGSCSNASTGVAGGPGVNGSGGGGGGSGTTGGRGGDGGHGLVLIASW